MRKGVAGLRFAVPPNAPFSQLSALSNLHGRDRFHPRAEAQRAMAKCISALAASFRFSQLVSKSHPIRIKVGFPRGNPTLMRMGCDFDTSCEKRNEAARAEMHLAIARCASARG